MKDLPWGKIGTVAASLLAAAVGGTLHLESDASKLSSAEAGQKLQTQHVLAHWGEDCPLTADSQDHSVQVRYCPSDGCYHFRVSRPGTVLSFFAVAGVPEVPKLTVALPILDIPGSVILAQPGCIDPVKHGSPDGDPPITYGADLGGGWVQVYMNYYDGCQLERAYHRPTGAWSEQWRWTRCVGHG